MGTLLFGQNNSWPSATIAQAWNQEWPLQYHHPVRVQHGRQQFCVITIMALHGETMSPMPLCWNRLAPWPCISFSVSITKICNFWQLLAVMKPITLHPDLRWSHQFFALSPYTFTIAQNCPTPPPPLPHHHRNSPTYPDKRPNIYPATFKMSGSSLIINTLGTVFSLSFVLCAKTKEKELLQKQLSQLCTCNDRSRIKHWTTIDGSGLSLRFQVAG